MNDHNLKVEPTQFDAVGQSTADTEQPSAATAAAAGAASGHRWVMPALIALVLLAIVVFFWLPSRVATPDVEIDPGATNPGPRPALNTVSPWSDAQQARIRKEAQDVLQEMLDLQYSLEELGVELWAAEAFEAATAEAVSGDELYRKQQFVEAGEAYTKGRDLLKGLLESAPAVYSQALADAQQALDNNQAQLAQQHLAIAERIEPGSLEVAAMAARSATLDQVVELVSQAVRARANGDLETAASALQQATRLDPQHAQAAAELAAVVREQFSADFNAAMSRGYQAMDEGRYNTAEKAFIAARKMRPGSAETESAIQQARAARTRSQIETLQRAGVSAAEGEKWDTAQKAYEDILAIDSSVVFARVGLIESRERASIDARLSKAIAQPERLGDEAIYQQTRRLYTQASALQNQGPRISQQLRELGEALRYAQTPVEVVVTSDELTSVTVFKVARLGSFRQHTLELKPGTYTAVGVRPGYRDVRRQFTVRYGAADNNVTVICEESI